MKKMKTVFVVDRTCNRATNEVMPGNEWVVNGEGVATIKHDGTSCMVRDGKLYKRFDLKAGRNMPEGFEPCEAAPDANTGHWPGWVPVNDAPENRWHNEAFANGEFEDGTYELVGPKVNGNKYSLTSHALWKHGCEVVDAPRTFEELRDWLEGRNIEGLVFHRGNGEMAKLRRKDFGFKW